MSAKRTTTDSEIDAAIARSAREAAAVTRIDRARYDRTHDTVVTNLSTGATLIVPRARIPGFRHATATMLRTITVQPGGQTLWADAVDDGVTLDQLLEYAAGAQTLKVLGGRIAGRSRSSAKAAAARANGAKGGRPRKAVP